MISRDKRVSENNRIGGVEDECSNQGFQNQQDSGWYFALSGDFISFQYGSWCTAISVSVNGQVPQMKEPPVITMVNIGSASGHLKHSGVTPKWEW